MGFLVKSDRPTITVDVPAEWAARYMVNEMSKPVDTRELLPLRIGETDLGMWQVISITSAQVGHEQGSSVVAATLRPVWP